MMKINSNNFKLFITLLMVMLSHQSFAKSTSFNMDSSDFLTTSCQDVLRVYQNRDEESLLAGVRTSMSEALKAGYCIGRIQQFIQENGYCNKKSFYDEYNSRYTPNKNWFEIAKKIANHDISNNNYWHNTKAMIEDAYCND